MTRDEEIKDCMNVIEHLKKVKQSMESAIKDGSKRTGKPLSASTTKGYTVTIKSHGDRIKYYEEKIKELKNRPKKFDDFWNMAHGPLVLEALKYYEESQRFENKLLNWEEWYKRQDRRPPMNKSEIPQGWHVVVGGVQG